MKMHLSVKKTVTKGAVVLAAMLGMSLPALHAFAGEFLTGDEVKELVSGNTVRFEVAGKGKFKAYLDSNGKVTRIHDGQIAEGTWRINKDGALCVHYTGKADHCGKVKKNSDGTHTRVDDAKITNHWTKVSKGKELK